jgi:hypothetical protein
MAVEGITIETHKTLVTLTTLFDTFPYIYVTVQ